MGSIYKITNNINQKIYIGYTTQSIAKRMRQHRNDDIKHDTVLGRAISKYGWGNFSYEIVEESDDKNKLLDLEVYYISHYDSLIPNGYNMTKGGEKLFGEHNPFYGKTHSEETRRTLSERGKTLVGDKNPFYGKKHREETKQKISKANSKKVVRLNENREILEVYSSGVRAGEWCREQGLTKGKTPQSDIFKRCKDGKKAFGYYWEYSEEGVETRE